jgi:hypothetical protein
MGKYFGSSSKRNAPSWIYGSGGGDQVVAEMAHAAGGNVFPLDTGGWGVVVGRAGLLHGSDARVSCRHSPMLIQELIERMSRHSAMSSAAVEDHLFLRELRMFSALAGGAASEEALLLWSRYITEMALSRHPVSNIIVRGQFPDGTEDPIPALELMVGVDHKNGVSDLRYLLLENPGKRIEQANTPIRITFTIYRYPVWGRPVAQVGMRDLLEVRA